MKQYKLVNNLVGWLAFVIAAYTYCMTIEPTASFWDCPEFITDLLCLLGVGLLKFAQTLARPAHLSLCLPPTYSANLQATPVK